LRRGKASKEGLPDEEGCPETRGQQGGRNLMKRLPTRSDLYQGASLLLLEPAVRRASTGKSLFLIQIDRVNHR
jgi:hypothetical protein